MVDKQLLIYINSDYFTTENFTKWLNHLNYEVVDIMKCNKHLDKHIDFVYIDATTKKFIKDYIYKNVKINCMSYVIPKIEFYDKDILHQYVKRMNSKLFGKFFLEQQNINDNTLQNLDSNKIYIVKPIPGYAGDGIRVFRGSEKNEIKKHIYQIEKKTKKKEKWIIQDYISNPFLLNGKKFHMRIMILLCNNNAYFYKDFLIYPAQKKFTLDDLSPEIHDTHGTLTEPHEKKMFPNDFIKNNDDPKFYKDVYIKIANLFIELRKIGLFDHKCYNGNSNCYQLFGADIMITDDYQVKCIEINYKPGLTNFLNRMPFLIKGIIDLTLLKKNTSCYYKI
jgi:hypothetical protein